VQRLRGVRNLRLGFLGYFRLGLRLGGLLRLLRERVWFLDGRLWWSPAEESLDGVDDAMDDVHSSPNPGCEVALVLDPRDDE